MKLRDILGILRDSYCRTVGIEYMHIQDPDQRRWIQERVERPHEKPPREEQLRILAKLNQAEAFETFLQTKFVGPEAVQPRGRRDDVPLLDEICEAPRPGGPRRGDDRHGAPRPAQRARQHRRPRVRADLP
jgi:2-oxoglutarate dehydrogenase E1 component